MNLKRYDLGRKHAHNIGVPAITEQPEGKYVHFDDYEAQRLESELWRARATKAEQQQRDLLRSALERWNR